ncbi:MAG TPA: hypothetical protein VGK39_06265, partial [Cyclobacteriaceae bacterium]
IWSAIALDRGTYLIETTENDTKVLFHSTEDFGMLELMPLPIEINGKPALIATFGVNETDMIWNSLLVFNSNEYEVVESSRVSVKD